MQDIALEIKAVSKSFKTSGNLLIVDNVNLKVNKGEAFGFLGSNGAGKTTTIKMICGLVTPTAGRIIINGCDVAQERSAAMRQIGVVLEGTRNIYWVLSAWQNLMYFGELKGVSGKKNKERGEQLLRELELWDRRNEAVMSFSRGMQQRVAIACALIADPPIVILDEPTLGLDVEATQIVKSLLTRLVRDDHKTIIITSHQLDVVQDICQRVAIIHKGKIIADKSLADLRLLFRQDYYHIKIQGSLNSDQRSQLKGFMITANDGITSLIGPVVGLNSLNDLLDNLRTRGLALVSVVPVEPDLEEMFLKLVQAEKETNNFGRA